MSHCVVVWSSIGALPKIRDKPPQNAIAVTFVMLTERRTGRNAREELRVIVDWYIKD